MENKQEKKMKKEVTVDVNDFDLAADIIARAMACEDDVDQRRKIRSALRAAIVVADELRDHGSVTVSVTKK